uniref:ATP synthase subunit gamma n=1 Tax=Panagrolaimus sp. ES5 TaxID=591445 RepID=A0AC34G9G4_9BILA
MLSQGVTRVSLAAANAILEQQRGMATLKDISIRLKSVKNIQKITKSMKMVAAAKYAKAERDLKGARAYGVGAQTFYDNIGSSDASATEGGAVATTPKEGGKKHLLVLMTSDRGLCGAVHSSIAKEAKLILKSKPADVEYKIVCIGDKSKAALQRLYPKDLLFT